MTNIADNLHIGAASTGIGANASGGFGFGPVGRIYVYDIVPLALNATAYAASQSPGSGAITLSAGTGVTATVVNGVTRYVADVPRAVTITSGGVDTGITFTVNGYDVYGAPMTQSLAGGSTATVTTLKAFASIVSVTHTGSAAGTVTIGTADVFGLPVAVVDAGYIIHVGWNGALATNAGTFVAAVQTVPSTSALGDVRGTYAQAGAASNGSIRLVVSIALSDLNIGGSSAAAGHIQTVVGVKGQPQV